MAIVAGTTRAMLAGGVSDDRALPRGTRNWDCLTVAPDECAARSGWWCIGYRQAVHGVVRDFSRTASCRQRSAGRALFREKRRGKAARWNEDDGIGMSDRNVRKYRSKPVALRAPCVLRANESQRIVVTSPPR
jgi:hypothetical protein